MLVNMNRIHLSHSRSSWLETWLFRQSQGYLLPLRQEYTPHIIVIDVVFAVKGETFNPRRYYNSTVYTFEHMIRLPDVSLLQLLLIIIITGDTGYCLWGVTRTIVFAIPNFHETVIVNSRYPRRGTVGLYPIWEPEIIVDIIGVTGIILKRGHSISQAIRSQIRHDHDQPMFPEKG